MRSYREILKVREVVEVGDGVVREVEVLEVDVLVEVLDRLDVVGGEAEPGEELELLQALHRDHVVVGQVEDLEVAQLLHLEHPDQLVVLHGQLEKRVALINSRKIESIMASQRFRDNWQFKMQRKLALE